MENWRNRWCFVCCFVNQRPDINKINKLTNCFDTFIAKQSTNLTPTVFNHCMQFVANPNFICHSTRIWVFGLWITTPQNLTILARIIAKFRFAPWEKCSSIEIAPNTPINLAFPPNIFHVILSPRHTFIKLFSFFSGSTLGLSHNTNTCVQLKYV